MELGSSICVGDVTSGFLREAGREESSFTQQPLPREGSLKGVFMGLGPPVPQGNCCSHLQIRTLLCNWRCGSIFWPTCMGCVAGQQGMQNLWEKPDKREAGWGPWMELLP